jgi:HAD superfamily hydrolase (TIGR01509 family)
LRPQGAARRILPVKRQGKARCLRAILIAVAHSDSQLAFLFDMDGVLINSMPLHTRSWEVYLQRLGLTVEDLEARMHGRRNPELVRDLLGEELPDDVVLEHGAAKERLFRELMGESIDQFKIPGLLDFLNRYPEIPKAIGSNAERANIDFTLDRLGLRPYFQVLVDGGEVARPKPFPDVYLMAAERLGFAPEECIVFEDSPAGTEAAQAAGMRVVAVETIPTDFADVDLVIKDFLDAKLEPWIRAQTSAEAGTPVAETGVKH